MTNFWTLKYSDLCYLWTNTSYYKIMYLFVSFLSDICDLWEQFLSVNIPEIGQSIPASITNFGTLKYSDLCYLWANTSSYQIMYFLVSFLHENTELLRRFSGSNYSENWLAQTRGVVSKQEPE